MAVLVAALLAIFVLPSPWGIAAVVAGAVVELGEGWFWIRYSRRRRAVTGAEGLIGRTAEVVERCRPYGRVRIQGELWNARCEAGAEAGEHVHVTRFDPVRLTLEVVPAREPDYSPRTWNG